MLFINLHMNAAHDILIQIGIHRFCSHVNGILAMKGRYLATNEAVH